MAVFKRLYVVDSSRNRFRNQTFAKSAAATKPMREIAPNSPCLQQRLPSRWLCKNFGQFLMPTTSYNTVKNMQKTTANFSQKGSTLCSLSRLLLVLRFKTWAPICSFALPPHASKFFFFVSKCAIFWVNF